MRTINHEDNGGFASSAGSSARKFKRQKNEEIIVLPASAEHCSPAGHCLRSRRFRQRRQSCVPNVDFRLMLRVARGAGLEAATSSSPADRLLAISARRGLFQPIYFFFRVEFLHMRVSFLTYFVAAVAQWELSTEDTTST